MNMKNTHWLAAKAEISSETIPSGTEHSELIEILTVDESYDYFSPECCLRKEVTEHLSLLLDRTCLAEHFADRLDHNIGSVSHHWS
jgi:hypothetical protein